ncbi:MAG: FAD-dependent oxidoreductase, partial [Candidatus Deferrimicrobium sp.]
IGDVPLAERILAEGKADLIAMGRPLIADPYLPQKALEGRLDEIVPCIFCGQGCIQRVLERDEAITCTVNPAAAMEGKTHISKAPKGKRVVVMGGGPAGLVASRVAAERGHHVQLYEKSSELGGQLRLSSLPPGKQRIQRLASYLLEGVRKAGVTVFLGKEFIPAASEGVEALVVAAGSRPVIPPIPGVDRMQVVIAGDVLLGRAAMGDPVVVIGGGQVGAEVAEFLAEEGRNVTILEIAGDIAQGMPSIARLPLLCHLDEMGVRIWTKARVREIGNDTVDVEYKGAQRQIPAATVVIATGAEPNVPPLDAFREKIPEVYVIGDSARPRSILEAIAEGFDVGSRL